MTAQMARNSVWMSIEMGTIGYKFVQRPEITIKGQSNLAEVVYRVVTDAGFGKTSKTHQECSGKGFKGQRIFY